MIEKIKKSLAGIRGRRKRIIFSFSITEGFIKAVKYQAAGGKREFLDVHAQAVPEAADDKRIAEGLKQALKSLDYRGEPVIFILTRNLATCRMIKIPPASSLEIENILGLQASRYLPYPPEELITGYQQVFTDKEGYANINLVIVHRDVAQRFRRIFQEAGIKNFKIFLSSFALSSLLNHAMPKQATAATLMDVNTSQAELVVVSEKKMLFSRYFKFNRSQHEWQTLFKEEIIKTRDACAKEVSVGPCGTITILTEDEQIKQVANLLGTQLGLGVHIFPYAKDAGLPEKLVKKIAQTQTSFAAVIGASLENMPDTLNLLPKELKELGKREARRKESLQILLLASGIAFCIALGTAKNLDNKSRYLARLKQELQKVSVQARPLEEIDKRIKFLETRHEDEFSSLNLLYALHKVMPASISLVSFTYEEGAQAVLRGNASQLNEVFAFASQLQQAEAFKNLDVKVRYASQKKIAMGEIVDFEIICAKR